MPGRSARTLFTLTETQRSLLETLARRPTAPQRLVRRCRIVLAAGNGLPNEQIARTLALKPDSVRLWRDRWPTVSRLLAEMEASLLLEATDPGKIERLLISALETALADAPRPGTPATFSPEQIVQIVAVALEDPAECDRPVSHWTPGELADEVMKRQIVERISPRHVGRFLKGSRPQAPSQSLLAPPGNRRSPSL